METTFEEKIVESVIEGKTLAVESGINDLPKIFVQKYENQEMFEAFFTYKCDSAATANECEEKRAKAAVENLQVNIANWISNSDDTDFRFKHRFFFDTEANRFSIILFSSVKGETKESATDLANTLAYQLRDILRLHYMHKFLPVMDANGLKSCVSRKEMTVRKEIVIGEQHLPVNGSWMLNYSRYASEVNGTGHMDDLIGIFMNRMEPCVLDILYEKVVPTRAEREKLEALERVVKTTNFTTMPVGLIQPNGSRKNQPELDEDGKKYVLSLLDTACRGKLMRARYFLNMDQNTPGAGPMCFVKDFIGSVSYTTETIEAEHADTFQQEPIISEIGENGSHRIRVKLQNIVTSQQFVRLFKLPVPAENGIPGMKVERLRTLKIPETLLSGRANALLLSKCFTGKGEKELHLRTEELLRHLYVCGMTGTGKTTLLRRLCFSMADRKQGFTLIDPHGDLSRDVFVYTQSLGMGEYSAANPSGVVYLDFENDNLPFCINLLANDGTEKQKMQVVEEVVGMIYRMIDPSEMAGPIFEKYFRLALRTLVEAMRPMSDFNRIIMDEDYRCWVLSKVPRGDSSDADLRSTLTHEFDEGDKLRNDGPIWPYITSKMDRFCDNPTLKRLLGSERDNLNFDDLLANGNIILVRLPIGIVPETIAYTIGTIVNMRINLAAKERIRIPTARRSPYFLVIDEFQNFVSASANFSHSKREERDLTSILSEARKYGLGLILANQYISQLDRGAREAIFGNVGGKIAFRVGIEDAKYLAATFSRGMQIGDFVDLPNFHGYASLLMNNMYIDPITVKTIR
ncbi:MAG TPA: DUF87 domain-containing protein [bacterium]|nr:DUF87 domain-containing protein [bacterium]